MENKFDIHRFDGKDFFLWKYQMKLFLLGQELWDWVDGTEEKPVAAAPGAPTEAERTALKNWSKKDHRAMMFLTQALSKSQLSKVVNCDSGKAIWDRLCATHEQKDESSVHMVQQQFYEYQKDKNDDVSTHISKVQSLARRLEDLGEKPTNNAVITKILMTLPPSYRGLVSAWDSTPVDERTLANLTARLLKEEEMDKKISRQHGEERAFVGICCTRIRRETETAKQEWPKTEVQWGLPPLQETRPQGSRLLGKTSGKAPPSERISERHRIRTDCDHDGNDQR